MYLANILAKEGFVHLAPGIAKQKGGKGLQFNWVATEYCKPQIDYGEVEMTW